MEQLSFLDYEKLNMVCKYRLTVIREEAFPYNSQLNTLEKTESFLKDKLALHKEPEEVLIVICVSTQLYPVAVFEACRGSISGALVSMKDVFKRIVLSNCAGFFIAHNHPGGSKEPSDDDIKTTEKFAEIAKLLEYRFHDHVIVTEDSFFSFRAHGFLGS